MKLLKGRPTHTLVDTTKLFKSLYTYQVEDYRRMLGPGSWLNLSEMGTGKTLEALAVVEAGNFKNPLILCPNSIMYEWKNQIDLWVGPGNAIVSAGAWDHKLTPLMNALQQGIKYKILNYEALRKQDNLDILGLCGFDIIICDEVHKLRNPDTKAAKGMWDLLMSLPHTKIIGQTGSPIMNYPNDLYVPLSLVKSNMFPRDRYGWHLFMKDYLLFSNGVHGPYIYGSQKQLQLRKLIQPFSITRTKAEALPYLPEKYYRRVLLQMPPEQRKHYDMMLTELRLEITKEKSLYAPSVIAMLVRLRQLNLDPKILGITCSAAKTNFLRELLDVEEKSAGGSSSSSSKLVVFSTFESYIDMLSYLLPEEERVIITGKVTPEERLKRVKRFQEDPSVRVCFGTIQTMGEGITLTAASNVVLLDRWWNEPTNTQAVDRLHRIGQFNKVQVVLPIVENSVDQMLDEILQRKDSLRNEFLPESSVRRTILESL